MTNPKITIWRRLRYAVVDMLLIMLVIGVFKATMMLSYANQSAKHAKYIIETSQAYNQ